MEGPRECGATHTAGDPPLHTVKPLPQTAFNRLFAAVYAAAIITLLYHHLKTLLLNSTSPISISITLIFLLSDLVLAFMWTNTQALRMFPVRRQEFPENLKKVVKREDFPGLDVFVCTADPYKEPPMDVVNTVLSVMAYEYPTEKVSVYVSDDGGSQLSLFALAEAAEFAREWLPFCRERNLVDRSPEAYFRSNHHHFSSEDEKIKMKYERMKMKVEDVLERGKVDDHYINGFHFREAFNNWTLNFTRHHHPSVIQVLLDASKDVDTTGHALPNLVYVSRQKSKTSPHHFKAGALNVLLRVSAVMTNASIILTLDCDMYSNDPQAPLRSMCYLCDPAICSDLAYIQFPQRFHGLNSTDIYCGEYKRLYEIQPMGFDGLMGPNYLGSGCFFRRRSFFGGPSDLVLPEVPELGPDHVVGKPIQSRSVLDLAHDVASCTYETQTKWGSKIGFRYGSLSEDYFTGLQMNAEGWKSIFCNPKRGAFLGDAPMCLLDLLNQQKRWTQGLLQVTFSRYCPINFGVRKIGLLMGLGYAQSAFWPTWSIPIFTYSFLPQLALLNHLYVFPKVWEPWFFLHLFLFVGAYGQDFLDFAEVGGTVQRWWNDQRIWLIRGLTCYPFGTLEFFLKHVGIQTFGFNVTSKVLDDEQRKRYERGVFEFGVHSAMFVTLTMAALVNLVALLGGVLEILRGNIWWEEAFGQVVMAGFGVLNCRPVYEALGLRRDKGKLKMKTIVISVGFTLALYEGASLILN